MTLSVTEQIAAEMDPITLPDLSGYSYRTQGHSGRIYTDADGIALKLFRADLPVDATHFEFFVLKALQSTTLPTLRLLDAVRIGDQFGFRYRWIEAEPFSHFMRANAHDAEMCASLFAKAHHQVHQIPRFERLSSQMQTFRSILTNAAAISVADRERLLAELEAMPQPETLCHGDFNPLNTLASKQAIHVIDWQRAHWGDPLSDVAKTWIKLSFHAYCEGKACAHEQRKLREFLGIYRRRYQKLTRFKDTQFRDWCRIMTAILSRNTFPDKRAWYLRLFDLSNSDPDRFAAFVTGQAAPA